MTSGKVTLLGIVFFLVAIAMGQGANGPRGEAQGAGKVYAFVNGNWFDGKTFQRWDMYSVDGRLTAKRPARVGETINLKNGYVVPPFADAHNGVFPMMSPSCSIGWDSRLITSVFTVACKPVNPV